MIKKRKIGIILILIGIGIPLVLFFFLEDGIVYTIETQKILVRKLSHKEVMTLKSMLNKKIGKTDKKILTTEEFIGLAAKEELILDLFGKNHFSRERWKIYTRNYLSIPYRKTLGIGILFILIGSCMFIFSFFPKESKSKK